jgi:hypothetical protein
MINDLKSFSVFKYGKKSLNSSILFKVIIFRFSNNFNLRISSSDGRFGGVGQIKICFLFFIFILVF